MNNDGYIDDEGEAFGGYPVLSNSEVLEISDDVSGLTFSASYIINIQTPTALRLVDIPADQPAPRLKRLR